MYYFSEGEGCGVTVVVEVLLEIFSLVHRIYDEINHTNLRNNSSKHSSGMREVSFWKTQLSKEILIDEVL